MGRKNWTGNSLRKYFASTDGHVRILCTQITWHNIPLGVKKEKSLQIKYPHRCGSSPEITEVYVQINRESSFLAEKLQLTRHVLEVFEDGRSEGENGNVPNR